eukprot:gene14331-15822_t
METFGQYASENFTADPVEVIAVDSTSLNVIWTNASCSLNATVSTASQYQIFHGATFLTNASTCSSQNVSSETINFESFIIDANLLTSMNGTQLSFVISNLSKWTCYQVKIVAISDTGEYCGSNSSSVFTATLQDAPTSAPRSFVVTNSSATTLSLTWEAPLVSELNGLISYYLIKYATVNCVTGAEHNASVAWNYLTVSSTSRTVSISNLAYWTCYSVNISAVTVGEGPSANVNRVRTSEYAPTSTPRSFVVTNSSATTLSLTWEAPLVSDLHGWIRYYLIKYIIVNCVTGAKINASVAWNYLTVSSTSRTVSISNLAYWTCYSVNISAVTVGEGPSANVNRVRTSEYAPTAAPRSFVVTNSSATTLSLTWEAPLVSDLHGWIRYYLIKYTTVNCVTGAEHNASVAWNYFTVDSTSRTVSISNLAYWTCYSVNISAVTVGEGPSANVNRVRTSEHAPTAAPRSFVVTNSSATTLSLTWKTPIVSDLNGLIKFYVIKYRIVNCAIGTETNTSVAWSFFTVGSTSRTVSISNLAYWTCYSVNISAVTVGEGPSANVNRVRTSEYAPTAAPRGFVVTNSSATTLSLTWEAPLVSDLHGWIRYYLIKYIIVNCVTGAKINASVAWNYFTVSFNLNATFITNLKFWTCYSVNLSAVTVGEGPFASFQISRTSEHAPTGPPRSFTASTVNSTSLYFTWDAPIESETHGFIRYYLITFTVVNCSTGHEANLSSQWTTLTIPGYKNTVFLTNVSALRCYDVRISAVTVGEGPFASLKRVQIYAPNQPPFLQAYYSPYQIVNKTITGGSSIHKIEAIDPEQGKLLFSIVRVTYYRNGTALPQVASNTSWAIKKPTGKNFDACRTAESYPFPRNLFCIGTAENNTIKATRNYSEFNKADYSLFRLDVFIYDDGSPQRNLTTTVYFRVKEDCTHLQPPIMAFVNKCPQYLKVLTAVATRAEVGYNFVIPNNSAINILAIKFLSLTPSMYLERNVTYQFSYLGGNRVLKTVSVIRRLLINTTVDTRLFIYLWKPIIVRGNSANVTVSLEIRNTSNTQRMTDFTNVQITVYAFDNAVKYCADTMCVVQFKEVEKLFKKTNPYECARDEANLLPSKYSSCQVIPKPPVWKNAGTNYVFLNATSPPGALVYKFVAVDATSFAKVLFSVVGVTYYRNDSSKPAYTYNLQWMQTSSAKTSIPNCKTAESYPFPRNLFCINSNEDTIRTTGKLQSSLPMRSSLFVLDVLIATEGKQHLNVTGKVYVRISKACTVFNFKSVCTSGAGVLSWRAGRQEEPRFNISVPSNSVIHKIGVDLRGTRPFNHIGKLVSYTFRDSKTNAVIRSEKHRLLVDASNEPVFVVNISPTFVSKGNVVLTVSEGKSFLIGPPGADFPPIKLYTLSASIQYCQEALCRTEYNKERKGLEATNSIECLTHGDLTHLYHDKFSRCKTVFSANASASVSKDLQNGSRILQVKTMSNEAVLYSIIAVSYWQNDSSPSAAVAKSNNWAVKTRSESLKSCSISENYPYPRNLFCINEFGLLMPTTLFRNRLQPLATVIVDILATNSKNPADNATLKTFVQIRPSALECELLMKTISSMRNTCNISVFTTLPDKSPSNSYPFVAPPTASLLVQIGIRSSILAMLKAGDRYAYVLTRANGKSTKIDRPMIFNDSYRQQNPYINSSLYRQPIVLAPRENIVITLTSIAGIANIKTTFMNLLVVTVPLKEYCLTSCFDQFNTVVNYGGKLAPRIHCLSQDSYYFDGRYGRCYGNPSPTLTVSNIQTRRVPAGTTIGRITATDNDASALTYGIISITSTAQKTTRKRSVVSGQLCSDALKEPVPLNYLCVTPSTGDIKVTSKFSQTAGEVLVVNAFALDSGTPKRYSNKSFTVTIYDPCKSVKVLYTNITSQSCFGGKVRIVSPTTSGSAPKMFISLSPLNLDYIVFLEVFPSAIAFPSNTLYAVFSIQVFTSIGELRVLGKMYNFTLARENTAAKSVKILVHVPVSGYPGIEVSAVAVANSSQSLPTSPSPTLLATTLGQKRRRRLVVGTMQNQTSQASQTSQTSQASTTKNASLSLTKDSVRIHGYAFNQICSNLQCVMAYIAWKKETQKPGLSICNSDPLHAEQYFKNCTDPPKFSNHPKDVTTKQALQASVSCSYRNFTGTTFQWLKDNKKFTPLPNKDKVTFSPDRKLTTRTLILSTDNPVMQGYYSCLVKDELNHIITSKSSLLRLKDVSSSKTMIKIRKTFNEKMKDTTSDEYKSLVNEVSSDLQARLNKAGLPLKRTIVLSNIRSGSVLLDASIYFLNVSNPAKEAICKGLPSMSTTQSSTNIEIPSTGIVAYDCCYTSQTGEEKIKGVITWTPVIADSFDTKKCPYIRNNKQYNATRFCTPNFNIGAQWQRPNISVCPYKTKTTQKLEQLSLTKIDATNVKTISAELDAVTSSVDKITNYLDIKFTADTMKHLINSKQKLDQITDDIMNATSNIMDVNEEILGSAQVNYKASSNILSSLDVLANSLPLNTTSTRSVVRRNVALAVKVVNTTSGMMINAKSIKAASGYNKISIYESSDGGEGVRSSAASIYLSPEMLLRVNSLKKGAANRLFSFVFENSRLFLSKNKIAGNASKLGNISSRILSATIGDLTMKNLTQSEEVKGLFRPLQNAAGAKVECVYWDFAFEDGFGAWLTNGCRHDGMDGNHYRCSCNHMTNFAILLDVTGKGTPKHAALALSIVTYIGCAISLICMVFTFMTYAIFSKLRAKLPPRILMCLCFALTATLIIFLAGIAAKEQKSCQAVGFLIHYFVLASFGWMAVEGFNLYLNFVKIVPGEHEHFILKSSIFAWGIPAIICAITAGVTKMNAYGKKNGDEWLCMVTGTPFYVAYLTPILLVVIGNVVVLAYVLRSLKRSSKMSKDKKMTGFTQIRIAVACSVLMGITWVIGLFAIDVLTLPVQILFCIFNSLQGLFIFLFYCIRNADVRKKWKSMCGIKRRDGSSKSTSGHQDYSKKGYYKPTSHNKAFSKQSDKWVNELQVVKPAPKASQTNSTTLSSTVSSRSATEDTTSFLKDTKSFDNPRTQMFNQSHPPILVNDQDDFSMYTNGEQNSGLHPAIVKLGFDPAEYSANLNPLEENHSPYDTQL